MGADGLEMILGKGLSAQGAVSAMSLILCAAQCRIGRVRMNQRVVVAKGIVGVARPGVVEWIGRHAGTNRVQLDIAISVQQVGFSIDQ